MAVQTNRSGNSSLGQITDLLGLIQGVQGSGGKETTSGGTSTQQTQVSDAGINQILQGILAGPGGVSSVGGAARRTGLYNSTTEDRQMGNLLATAANQAELARSPTVTTTPTITTETENEGSGLGTLGAIIGGLAGANFLYNTFSPMLGGQDDNTAAQSLGAGNIGSGGFSGMPIISGVTGNTSGSNPLDGFNFGLDPSAGGVSVGYNSGGAGGDLGGLGALSGLVGNLIGAAPSRNSSGAGGMSGGSVICTALMEKGELDADLYAKGSEYLSKLDAMTVLGYHIWAINVANKIRAGSSVLARICKPFAVSRTKLLATDGSALAHIKHPLGTLTKYVGEPACKLLGTLCVKVSLKYELTKALA